ncbi:phosphonate metabolism transcriptional regulator PhnF [Roseococcus sp. YIM B11640]|uniref:phosphonate metabolism transcriptional regulator PhnF n=1 Tax=Roseococcus sp. YIM B11640 TaxID=3133973 RepID=UPI003C7DD4DB
MVEASVTPGPAALDRGAGVALWRQIGAAIEEAIRAGHHAPGDRLPTETELAQRFRVNRHTIRRAMEELEGRGIVRVEQGRGSFVAEDVLDYPLGPRTRFSEIIRAQNREPAGRLLRLAEIPAEARVAELLEIRSGRHVILAERLAMADGRPVALGAHHFPAQRFPKIAAMLREDPSITRALAGSGVPDYRRRITRITARMPTAEEAEVLQQSRNRPLLISEAVNVDAEGRPVDATLTRYAAGRAQLVVEAS